MTLRRVLSFVVFLLVTGVAASEDWPQWRGPNRDDISPEKNLLKSWPKEGPKLVWQTDLKGVGYGGPAIAKGKIFVMAAKDPDKGVGEYVLCLDAKDGNQIWKAELPVGSDKYNFSYGNGPRSTPTVDGDTLYVLGARGDLLALKVEDGEKIWGLSLVKDFGGKIPSWGYSESVLIDGDKLICTAGGSKGAIVALEKKTGKKVWQSEGLKDGAGYASILANEIGGVRQYITQTSASSCGVRASDGKLLWRVAELARRTAVIPTPVVDGDHVFFTAGYGAGCELLKLEPDGKDGTKATVVYTKGKALANHHGGVVRIGDYIYGHSDRGGWLCMEFKKTGEEAVWNSSKLDKGCVTYADGHLYCYGQGKGTLVLVEASPKGWEETGRFDIPQKSKFPRNSGHIWTHPVVSNGKLYIRDHELMFCFDVLEKQQ